MNWSKATIPNMIDKCRDRERRGTGITVSPVWLQLVLSHYMQLLQQPCPACKDQDAECTDDLGMHRERVRHFGREGLG